MPATNTLVQLLALYTDLESRLFTYLKRTVIETKTETKNTLQLKLN